MQYHGAVFGDPQGAEAAVGKFDNLFVDDFAILVFVDRLSQHNLQES